MNNTEIAVLSNNSMQLTALRAAADAGRLGCTETMRILGAKLLPFERTILGAVETALPTDLKSSFKAQLGHINKIQRLIEWNEIEF